MSVPVKKPQAPQQIEDTVFFLPSIDLKVRVNRLKVISCRVRNESKPQNIILNSYDMYVCFIFGHNKLFHIVCFIFDFSINFLSTCTWTFRCITIPKLIAVTKRWSPNHLPTHLKERNQGGGNPPPLNQVQGPVPWLRNHPTTRHPGHHQASLRL